MFLHIYIQSYLGAARCNRSPLLLTTKGPLAFEDNAEVVGEMVPLSPSAGWLQNNLKLHPPHCKSMEPRAIVSIEM